MAQATFRGSRSSSTTKQVRCILRAYEVDDRGRRRVRRAFFSRPKGRAKPELAAMLGCAEALGPVRFNGVSLVTDDSVVPDLTGEGVGRIERGLALGELELAKSGRRRTGQIALSRSLVADPLMGRSSLSWERNRRAGAAGSRGLRRVLRLAATP